MKRWLENLSIRNKTFLAPGFILLLLLSYSMISVVANNHVIGLTDRMWSEGIERTAAIEEAEAALIAAQSDVYRYSIWTGRGVSGERVEELRAEIETALENFALKISEIDKFGSLQDESAAALEQILSVLDAYRDEVTSVLDITPVDPAVGTMMLNSAETTYETMLEEFGVITGQIKEQNRSLYTMVLGSEKTVLKLAITSIGIALGIGLAITFFLSGLIYKPVVDMTASLRGLAGGNLDVDIPTSERRDEIGVMAEALGSLRATSREAQQLRDQQEAMKAEEETRRREQMAALAREFDAQLSGIIGAISEAARQIEDTSASLSGSVEAASGQISNVAAAAEQASSNVQTVAAAAEELSSSIAEVAGSVASAAEKARSSADSATDSERELEALNKAIAGVGEILQSITGVAEQTNLLALNATIEAARAGEAGKGFAVVASEVKMLANQTREMTDEISARIAEVQQSANRSSDVTRTIISQVREIDAAAAEVASAVEQQATATSEISQNSQEAAAGTAEVSRNAQGLSAATAQVSGSTATLGNAAQLLLNRAEELRKSADGFVEHIRAA